MPDPAAPRGHRATAALGTFAAATILAAATWQLCQVALHDAFLAVDDAYISFRYAENLRHGLGLTWNADSAPCEGYTNLLYVLCLAISRTITGADPEWLAATIACTSASAIAILLLVRFGHRKTTLGFASAIAPLGFVLDLHTHAHACRGLETMLFALLALGTVASLGAVVRSMGRYKPALAVAVGCTVLAFLCRPDGVLLAGTGWCTVLVILRARREPIAPTCLALGVVIVAGIAYAGWKLAYFGNLLPTAFYMKGDVTGFAGINETVGFLRDYWPLLLSLFSAMVLTVGTRSRRLPPEATLAVVISVVWLGYTSKILHELGYHHRFVYPIVPVLWLGVAAMLGPLVRRLSPRAVPVASALAVTVLVGLHVDTLRHRQWQLAREPPIDPYSETYHRLGRAIHEVDDNHDLTLLCSHAGATPFAADCRHIDSGGLTDCWLSKRGDPADRAAYLAAAGIDLRTAHLFPASVGSTSPADEPRWSSTYLQTWHVGAPPEDLDASGRVQRSMRTAGENATRVFAQMRTLRDNWTLLGEMRIRQRRWRVFVYANRGSPQHDRLVRALGPRLDIQPAQIDWDGWPE